MKKVFEYFDYQIFLHDFYEEKKKENACISYRYLGAKLHLDPGFLLKVIQGKQHLAQKSIPHLCDFFKFSEREKEYFQLLVCYNKSKSATDIKLYFEKLVQLKDTRAKSLQASQYAFYQKWYHSAIHALLSIHPFNSNYKHLASLLTPAISAAQARESIRLLARLGIVQRDEAGIYRPRHAFLTTGEKWQSVAIHQFQKENLRLSAEALEHQPKEIRDISTATVALSSKDLPEIRERIRQLRQAILTLENENKPDIVFQINIQAFPVTSIIKDDV
jgi:uncharacterized protein (TIGR02147 family)